VSGLTSDTIGDAVAARLEGATMVLEDADVMNNAFAAKLRPARQRMV